MCERARTNSRGESDVLRLGIYFLRAGRNVCAIFEKAGGLCCLVPTTAEPNINLQKSLAVSGLRANPNVLRPAQLGLGTRAGRRRA